MKKTLSIVAAVALWLLIVAVLLSGGCAPEATLQEEVGDWCAIVDGVPYELGRSDKPWVCSDPYRVEVCVGPRRVYCYRTVVLAPPRSTVVIVPAEQTDREQPKCEP